MLAMQVTKHPAGLDPVDEGKCRDIAVSWFENMERVAAKSGVRLMSSWDDRSARTVYALFETPSMDDLKAMMMDPAASGPPAFCTTKVFPVYDHQTTLKMIKR